MTNSDDRLSQAAGVTAREPVVLELVPDGRAAGQARRAVREVLLAWQLPGLVDRVVLTVSELVANATRHGEPPVAVTLRHDKTVVIVHVRDAGAATVPLGRRGSDDCSESGRGLTIVQTLADRVTVDPAGTRGKVVSALFVTSPYDGSGAVASDTGVRSRPRPTGPGAR